MSPLSAICMYLELIHQDRRGLADLHRSQLMQAGGEYLSAPLSCRGPSPGTHARMSVNCARPLQFLPRKDSVPFVPISLADM